MTVFWHGNTGLISTKNRPEKDASGHQIRGDH